jgi:uncharacterized protein (TIGR00251 family)
VAEDLFEVESTDEGPVAIILRLRVQPGAGRSSVTGRHGDTLAVKVGAPPIGGRANLQCIELVADILGVRKSAVEIVSGEKNRQKRVRVVGIEPARVQEALARELRSTAARPATKDRRDKPGRSRP